ncbi:Alpha/beta hydrolase fold-1 [Lenzites betulinus]|nr:Alpha/beta hydrolase fold-1 [Lenzites betulinus]
MEVDTKEFVLTGRPEHGGFNLTFLRVTPKLPAGNDASPPSGQGIRRLSLFLLHCVNSHKETWVPALQHLFELQSKAPNNRFTIVEAWSMDAPSHGHSAVLNESKLYKYPDGIDGSQWVGSIKLFLDSGLISGDSVVGIGHSAGACVIVQTTAVYPQDRPPYSSIILVEPPMMTREIYAMAVEEGTALLRAIEIARTRKDIWASREKARAWFAKRLPWNRWDPRVFDLHIQHALCELPTMTYPGEEGVTLCVTRAQEVGGYSHYDDCFDALEIMKTLCSRMPVHTVFGEIIDLVPAITQEANVDESEGRRMKSIVRVAGAGHMVVQEDPRGTALAIWGILHEDYAEPVRLAARL